MKNKNGGQNPNIIYILADDMGYGDISYLNADSKLHTRNLDEIARQGLAFTDAHSTSAVCTPSRYGILTGRYNWRSVLKEFVLFGYHSHLIEDGRLTVADMLREEGYRTACIGKWHLGMDWAKNGPEIDDVDFTKPIANGPLTFGFDYFFGISASLDMPPYVYIENDHVTAIPDHVTSDMGKRFWREGPTAPDFRHEEVLPKLTEKALEIIEECNNEPFFLYFPLPAPHTPILPTSEFQGLSNTNEYGDFVLMVDDLIGKITKKVDELKIRENTIIIFTSDNGCSPAANYEELALCGHNPSYVYRGYKADIYEGGHRIPLLVRWPASISPGRVTEEPVCLSDLFATIAEILGYNIPDNTAEDSVSNLPVWIQSDYVKPLREAIVHHSIFGSFSIRKGKWKLELCPGSGGWSYPKPGQEHKDSPPIQLYDLEKDISEKNNVQDLYPDIVNELKDLLIKYIKEGRSTPGRPQKNTGDDYWSQLSWMNSE